MTTLHFYCHHCYMKRGTLFKDEEITDKTAVYPNPAACRSCGDTQRLQHLCWRCEGNNCNVCVVWVSEENPNLFVTVEEKTIDPNSVFLKKTYAHLQQPGKGKRLTSIITESRVEDVD